MLNAEKITFSEPRLHPLASTIRAILQPRASKSLAALALLVGLNAGSALAATITVDASCTLVDAITAANSDTATGGCPAGSGADMIVLPAKSVQTLTEINNYIYYYFNGLPVITSRITIAGNGSTIKRASAFNFRIFMIGRNGNLTLNRTTVTGGTFGGGGGLYNVYGTLTLNNCTVSGNTASMVGGGLYNILGKMILNNSTVSGNSSNYFGGGLGTVGGTVSINASTVSGNIAKHKGGGLLNMMSTVTFSNSTVSGNKAGAGGSAYRAGVLVAV